MPSPTRNGSMRHLMALMMAMMGILFCLMGLAILQTLDHMSPQPPKKRKKKVVRRRKKRPGHAKNPPTTDPKISHLNTLPVELLMHIFEYLAPDNVQPHLDSLSYLAYEQAQKNLRNVCLVSKQMDAVARRYLYRGVIVSNVDILAYLLRTLVENQTVAQNVQRIVFQVPFSSEDENYRRPSIAVLNAHPDHCGTRPFWFRGDLPDITSEDWQPTWDPDIMGKMHFQILRRTNNLEALIFASLHPRRRVNPWPPLYSTLENLLCSALGIKDEVQSIEPPSETANPVVPFLTKVKELQFLADSKDGQRPYSPNSLQMLLAIPYLKTVKSFHDDGDWFDVHPRPPRRFPYYMRSWNDHILHSKLSPLGSPLHHSSDFLGIQISRVNLVARLIEF